MVPNQQKWEENREKLENYFLSRVVAGIEFWNFRSHQVHVNRAEKSEKFIKKISKNAGVWPRATNNKKL